MLKIMWSLFGGGNVALDVALTALRQGAKQVQIACLEKETSYQLIKRRYNRLLVRGCDH